MEKSTAIRRINRIGQVGQIVTAINMIMCVLAGLSIFVLFIDIADPTSYQHQNMAREEFSAFFQSIGYSNQENILGIAIGDGDPQNAEGNQEGMLRPVLLLLLGILTEIAASAVSVFFASKLCTALRYCPSPFDGSVIRRMRHFAFSLIPWCFINSVSGILMHSYLGGTFRLGIDTNMLCLVLVVLALTFIFQYGAVLQRESDETL